MGTVFGIQPRFFSGYPREKLEKLEKDGEDKMIKLPKETTGACHRCGRFTVLGNDLCVKCWDSYYQHLTNRREADILQSDSLFRFPPNLI